MPLPLDRSTVSDNRDGCSYARDMLGALPAVKERVSAPLHPIHGIATYQPPPAITQTSPLSIHSFTAPSPELPPSSICRQSATSGKVCDEVLGMLRARMAVEVSPAAKPPSPPPPFQSNLL